MKSIVYVLLGLLVSLPCSLSAQDKINAGELKELSMQRKVVKIISKDGKQLIKKYLNKLNKKPNQKGGYTKIFNPISKKFIKLNDSSGLKILQKYVNLQTNKIYKLKPTSKK